MAFDDSLGRRGVFELLNSRLVVRCHLPKTATWGPPAVPLWAVGQQQRAVSELVPQIPVPHGLLVG
jgi:hypothetical protein